MDSVCTEAKFPRWKQMSTPLSRTEWTSVSIPGTPQSYKLGFRARRIHSVGPHRSHPIAALLSGVRQGCVVAPDLFLNPWTGCLSALYIEACWARPLAQSRFRIWILLTTWLSSQRCCRCWFSLSRSWMKKRDHSASSTVVKDQDSDNA